jgi:hypothetical protein
MIPKITITKYTKGKGLVQIREYLPSSKLEKAIVNTINGIFDFPNMTEITKDISKPTYYINVHTSNEISWQDLKIMEERTNCQVKIKSGLYGLVMFFTPKKDIKAEELNPSKR